MDWPGEQPAPRQPAVQHDGAVKVLIMYIYIWVEKCWYPWLILGASLHPCARPSGALPSGGGRHQTKGENYFFVVPHR